MKNKIIYNYIGKVLFAFSILMLFPMIICLIKKESLIPFLIPFLLTLIIGILLNLIKTEKQTLYAKDGFIIVSLSWIIISLISALPFSISHYSSYIDGIFEAVSGLTTTGASIFKDVTILPKSLLFWRSYMHFIGGMGVLTFVMAVIPLSRKDKSMHVLNAEMPGNNVAKIVPSTKKTLLYLYALYLSLSLIEILFLMIGKVNFFDSLLITMSTVSTGGLTFLNDSIASYSSYVKLIVALFMFLSGINFNIYLLLVMKKNKAILKSEELKVYILLFIFSIIFIFANIWSLYPNIKDALLSSIFHVSSIMTSTGFSSGNINIYPTCVKILLLFLMLISACAGSTCGGFKISRLILCFKRIKRDLLKIVHPNSVQIIKYEGKRVDDTLIDSNSTFLFLYAILLIIILLIVSIDGYSFEITINAVFSTFSNTGLCFEISNFSIFSNISKIVMSLGMLLGRLEIFPLVVLFSELKKSI